MTTKTKVEPLAGLIERMIPAIHELETLYDDAYSLVEHVNQTAGIEGAEAVFFPSVRRLCKRRAELGIPGDPDFISSEDLGNLLTTLHLIAREFGIHLPAFELSPVKEAWFEETKRGQLQYIDEEVFPELSGIRRAMTRTLVPGKYVTNDRGELLRIE